MALNSVLPDEIGEAAQIGDLSQVYAWLDAGGSVDAQDSDGFSLLACCAMGIQCAAAGIGDERVALARNLISRGANVNIQLGDNHHRDHVWSPLHFTCRYIRTYSAAPSMVSLLLAAGANVNARNEGYTPLGLAVGLMKSDPARATGNWLEIVTLLLKGGASLDECKHGRSAETVFDQARQTQNWAEDENVLAVRALLDGVRQHGSYKRYMRAPHRNVLACRSLAMRGYLAPQGTRRTRGAQKWKAAVAFLAKQGDNGIVWNIDEATQTIESPLQSDNNSLQEDEDVVLERLADLSIAGYGARAKESTYADTSPTPAGRAFVAALDQRSHAASTLPNLFTEHDPDEDPLTSDQYASLTCLAMLATTPPDSQYHVRGLGFTSYPCLERDHAEEASDDDKLLYFARGLDELNMELPPLDALCIAYEMSADVFGQYFDPQTSVEYGFFMMLYEKIDAAHARRRARRWTIASCRHRIYGRDDTASSGPEDATVVVAGVDAFENLVRHAPPELFHHTCQFL